MKTATMPALKLATPTTPAKPARPAARCDQCGDRLIRWDRHTLVCPTCETVGTPDWLTMPSRPRPAA